MTGNLSVAIFENAFDAELCRAAAEAWPASDWPGWHAVYQSQQQRKRACNRWEDMPAPCRQLLSEMMFLDPAAFALGLLVPDTGLWGGGMQEMGAGDVLGLHLDADTHALSGMHRAVNAILFLTPDWREEWGGNLELWSEDKSRRVASIAPVFNRLVLFAATDTSWHGIPQPLACPADAKRKTLACWWYGPPQGKARRQRAAFA